MVPSWPRSVAIGVIASSTKLSNVPDSSPGPVIVRSASGSVVLEPSSFAIAAPSLHLAKPVLSGPISEYRSAKLRQVTAVLLTEVRIDRPSIAILSSVYSMPAAWQMAASSSLILREASEMSVSPAQNFAKPSPVPGPSIVYLKSGLLRGERLGDARGDRLHRGRARDADRAGHGAAGGTLGRRALAEAPLSAAVVAGAVVAPPPLLQAATNRVAANASAPTRLGRCVGHG